MIKNLNQIYSEGEKSMKLLVISDTHGNLKNFKRVLEIENPVDMIFHLGDICHDEEEIRDLAGEKCTVAMVRGNCDYFTNEPYSRDIAVGNHRIYMEHGNGLPDSLMSIAYKAEEKGADVLLFGHTHRPMITRCNDVIIANPGSLSEPRQADGCPTYIIIETDDKGDLSFKQKKLDE